MQSEFESANSGEPSLVQPSDVAFALHAEALTIVTLIQIIIYEKGGQRVSWLCIGLSSLMLAALTVIFSIAATDRVRIVSDNNQTREKPNCATNLQFPPSPGHSYLQVNWLFALNIASYFKLAISVFKYIPQGLSHRSGLPSSWGPGSFLAYFPLLTLLFPYFGLMPQSLHELAPEMHQGLEHWKCVVGLHWRDSLGGSVAI